MAVSQQVVFLFLLAIPIASISWTITHEEIFREMRNYCEAQSKNCKRVVARKVFYVFTCEYCFSHWTALIFVLLTGYHLLLADWRGVVIAVFALVWIANFYMSGYARLRLDIKAERKAIENTDVIGRRR